MYIFWSGFFVVFGFRCEFFELFGQQEKSMVTKGLEPLTNGLLDQRSTD